MRYLIIGLGIYGSNLARDLVAMGNEVIGVDANPAVVQELKDDLTTVYSVDTTESVALDVLPLSNIDLAIVAIGENFGASIKTVALLRQSHVKHIYARAIDPLHQAILECFNLDRILCPEQRAASDLAMEMMLGSAVVTMPVAGDMMIVRTTIPDYFVGRSYDRLKLDDFGIHLVAATRSTSQKSIIGVTTLEPRMLDISSDTVEQGDDIVCLATRKSMREMIRHTTL